MSESSRYTQPCDECGKYVWTAWFNGQALCISSYVILPQGYREAHGGDASERQRHGIKGILAPRQL
jgi:hypothetical protein